MTEEQHSTEMPEAPAAPPDAAQSQQRANANVVDAGEQLTAPYRILPPEEALAPVAVRAAPSRFIPVLAPAAWTFGVLLWAFVAMGVLTTLNGPGGRGPLVEEGLGVAFVLVATLGALVVAVRRSLVAAPTRGMVGTVVRGVVVALLAAPAWLIVTMIAAAVGKASAKNLDTPITIALLCLGGAAVLTARKLLGTGGHGATSQQRIIAGALWTVAVVVTVAAFIGTVAGD